MQKPLTQTDLEDGLKRLRLERGTAVEVHSSLRSLGTVQGGAATVLQALMNVVGEEGAIVMSAYNVTLPLPLTEAEKQKGILAKVRKFDDSADCKSGMGVIADTFRKWPGVVPGKGAHRVCAWGRDADLHIRGYKHLLSIDGWVLLIGVDIHRCSCMHTAEEKAPLPQKIVDELYGLPEEIQREYPDDAWYVEYRDPRKPPLEDAWGKVQNEAERRGLIRRGRIGQAECMLFKARPVVALYEECLRTDPFGLFGVGKD